MGIQAVSSQSSPASYSMHMLGMSSLYVYVLFVNVMNEQKSLSLPSELQVGHSHYSYYLLQ